MFWNAWEILGIFLRNFSNFLGYSKFYNLQLHDETNHADLTIKYPLGSDLRNDYIAQKSFQCVTNVQYL